MLSYAYNDSLLPYIETTSFTGLFSNMVNINLITAETDKIYPSTVNDNPFTVSYYGKTVRECARMTEMKKK